MKKMFACLLVLVVCISFAGSACACTSFAVYGSQVFYGMNFDYFSTSLKFIIETHGAVKAFHLAFKIKLPGMAFFAKTGGMNSRGLFGACQVLMPTVEPPAQANNNDVVLPLFYESFAPLAKVEEVEAMLSKKRFVGLPGVSHHLLYADASKHAMILEPGADQNHITKMGNHFIVMTNFPVHGLNGKNDMLVEGMGADRYKIAHQYLQANADSFSMDKGMELLEKAVNKDPGMSTLCSMVFDPVRNEIFVALNGDFKKIWKVSLAQSTIETWSGFDKKVIMSLDSEGLLAMDESVVTLTDAD